MTRAEESPSVHQDFAARVVVLLEFQFPWLASENEEAVSGSNTVDQLVALHRELKRITAAGAARIGIECTNYNPLERETPVTIERRFPKPQVVNRSKPSV